MGGERSSSVRQRLAGKICAMCRASLPAPHTPGEQLCARCGAQRKPPRRVYMSFQTQSGWYCQFLEEDLKTPLPKKLSLVRQEKLFEIAERAGNLRTLEDRQAMQEGIRKRVSKLVLEPTETAEGKAYRVTGDLRLFCSGDESVMVEPSLSKSVHHYSSWAMPIDETIFCPAQSRAKKQKKRKSALAEPAPQQQSTGVGETDFGQEEDGTVPDLFLSPRDLPATRAAIEATV